MYTVIVSASVTKSTIPNEFGKLYLGGSSAENRKFSYSNCYCWLILLLH